jgi:Fe2+ or Zn2+ uptake regulation protein
VTVRNELRWFVQEHRVHVAHLGYDFRPTGRATITAHLHCSQCDVPISRAIPIDHPEQAEIQDQILLWEDDGVITRL